MYQDNGLRDHLLDHIADYIVANGGNLKDKAGRQMIRCILPGHTDSGPSFCYYPGTRSFFCYGCRKGGNLIDLIGHMEGITDKKEQYKRAIELYGHHYPDLVTTGLRKSPYNALESEKGVTYQKPAAKAPRAISGAINGGSDKEAEERAAAVKNALAEMEMARKEVEEGRAAEAKAYLEGRGISYDFATAKGIGYKDGRVYYPGSYPGGFFYIKKTTRNSSPKALISPGPGIASILNASHLQDPAADHVFIVEGPEDMLSVEQYGHPAIAVSTSLIGKVFNLIDKGHYYQDQGRVFLVAMDTDQAGRAASADLVKGLNERGIRAVAVDISGAYKDPNENLTQAGSEDFKRSLAEAVETGVAMALEVAADPQEEERLSYERNRASNRIIDMLEKVEKNKSREPMLSGFKKLDECLGGGLYEGLYILGAVPSLGKTTMALQIADQAAAAGNDVIYFTTEMSADTLIARSLSRISYKESKGRTGLTSRDMLNGYKVEYTAGLRTKRDFNACERDHLSDAMYKYNEYSPRIYYIEGAEKLSTEEIKKALGDHIRLEGTRPLVVVDYLQMLTPTDPRLSEKQSMDAAVKALKILSRGEGVPVLVISSFNRGAYGGDAKMSAYKESGGIEYGADVLLALQPEGTNGQEESTEKDIEDHKRQEERPIELKILKNREAQTGDIISYTYYAKYNTFEEGSLQVPITVKTIADTKFKRRR